MIPAILIFAATYLGDGDRPLARLRPFVAGLADPERAWMVVAMAATLAGNLTLVGSVANLILVEKARGRGVTVGIISGSALR